MKNIYASHHIAHLNFNAFMQKRIQVYFNPDLSKFYRWKRVELHWNSFMHKTIINANINYLFNDGDIYEPTFSENYSLLEI